MVQILRFSAAGVLLLVAYLTIELVRLPDGSEFTRRLPLSSAFIEADRERGVDVHPYPLSLRGESIPRNLARLVVISEDLRFFTHRGTDWAEVRKAFSGWVFQGKRLRGASTITQQLARNLYLSRERSLLRKLRETMIALKMERKLSKNRILALYMHVVEVAPGVYGIANGCRFFYRRSCSQLSLEEQAQLVALLPSPRFRSVREMQENQRHRLRTERLLRRLQFFS